MVSTRNESPYFSKTVVGQKGHFCSATLSIPMGEGKNKLSKQKTCLSTMQYLCTKMMSSQLSKLHKKNILRKFHEHKHAQQIGHILQRSINSKVLAVVGKFYPKPHVRDPEAAGVENSQLKNKICYFPQNRKVS